MSIIFFLIQAKFASTAGRFCVKMKKSGGSADLKTQSSELHDHIMLFVNKKKARNSKCPPPT